MLYAKYAIRSCRKRFISHIVEPTEAGFQAVPPLYANKLEDTFWTYIPLTFITFSVLGFRIGSRPWSNFAASTVGSNSEMHDSQSLRRYASTAMRESDHVPYDPTNAEDVMLSKPYACTIPPQPDGMSFRG